METFDKIARYLAGDSSSEEIRELEAWRKEASANEEEFCKLRKIWQASCPSENFKPNVEQAWLKVQDCLFQKSREVPLHSTHSIPVYRRAWAIAAAVALLILGSTYFLFFKQEASFAADENLAVLETKGSEKNDVLLADGSRVWLNQNSRILYPHSFDGASREVKLEGEGFFEITPMADKPFIIRAGRAKVQVLGTSFNLEVKEDVKLQVASGKVKFSTDKDSSANALVLEAGEAAVLNDAVIRKAKPDPNFLAWRTGAFIFEDSPLAEVLQVLEKHYHVQFNAPSETSCRLVARFEQQALEEVLEVLALTLQLSHDYKPGREIINLKALKENNCFQKNP